MEELSGLFEPALLAQVGSVPQLCFLSLPPGVSLISPGLLLGAHGPPLGEPGRASEGAFLCPLCCCVSLQLPAYLRAWIAAPLLTGGSQQEEKKK